MLWRVSRVYHFFMCSLCPYSHTLLPHPHPAPTAPGVPELRASLLQFLQLWPGALARQALGTALSAATDLISFFACMATPHGAFPSGIGGTKHFACSFLADTVVSCSSSWLRSLLPLADKCLPVPSKTEFKFLFLVLFLFGDELKRGKKEIRQKVLISLS